MSDDKLFQYLVSRVQTRETSTHAVASIASSTSLVLLGLLFTGTFSGIDKDIIKAIGISSPVFGFLYFEITFATQQRLDYREINTIIKKESTRKTNELDHILYGKNWGQGVPKLFLWRILLILPLIGWLSIGKGWSELIIIVFLVTIVLIALIIYSMQKRKDEQAISQKDSKTELQ